MHYRHDSFLVTFLHSHRSSWGSNWSEYVGYNVLIFLNNVFFVNILSLFISMSCRQMAVDKLDKTRESLFKDLEYLCYLHLLCKFYV